MNERRRLALRVTPDAERQIRGGHPWVFDRSVTSISAGGSEPQPGDLAVVFDAKRRFLAVGLFDPYSPIRVRILHQGEPTPIDDAWLAHRMASARTRRAPLEESGETTAYRVAHGENDGLPGLVVDRYGDVVVVKLYTASWIPHLGRVLDVVRPLLDARAVVVRLARAVARNAPGGVSDGEVVHGRLDSPVVRYLENGLCFEADVVRGQKTGAFLDQRENRAAVRDLAEGRRVLDVYACTGGFSAHAAAGGATSVCSIDISPGAIATTERNMAANLGPGAPVEHTTIVGDAMSELERIGRRGERFDLVVVDPPSFASRADQVAGALRAYARLGELAASVVEPGGEVMFASCSSRVSADQHEEALTRGVARARRSLSGPRRTGHPLDHPVGFPEGAYLKAVYATVERVRGRGTAGRR